MNTIGLSTRKRRCMDDCIIVYFETAMDVANSVQLSQLGCLFQWLTDPTQYADFITCFNGKKVFCLISNQLPEHTFSLLTDSPFVHRIYIIGTNEATPEHWVKGHPKVKGTYTEISPIIEALQHELKLVDRNSTPITILSPDSPSAQSNTLNTMFMYCQLLKETFLEMNHGEQAKRALVDICRQEYADNERGLCVINEFDQDYEKHSPTWWYTRDCFVYRMLNKALRTHDIEIINRFGFFIRDLHRQLEVLHRRLPPGKFTVYRGQR